MSHCRSNNGSAQWSKYSNDVFASGVVEYSPGSLLIVDKDVVHTGQIGQQLTTYGYDVMVARTKSHALRQAKEKQPQYILVEIALGDGNGLELLPSLKKKCPNSRIVVLTNYGSLKSATWAIKEGAVDFLPKPCDVETIHHALIATGKSPSQPSQYMSPEDTRRRYICDTLAKNNYNVSRAASLLGMSRHSVHRRLASGNVCAKGTYGQCSLI